MEKNIENVVFDETLPEKEEQKLTEEELENNLGTIAKSGSFNFKKENVREKNTIDRNEYSSKWMRRTRTTLFKEYKIRTVR